MEDVLDVYQRPYDPARPVVCLDETCKEVHSEVAAPLPAKPPEGDNPAVPARQDYEYQREGSVSIFAIYEALTGNAYIEMSEQRTATDFARVIKHLCDTMHPNAEKIVLVMDNLNTHTTASLYKAFEPEEARRLANRLEIHFTPKHGSWLNMAEIFLRLLSTQCIAGRFPDRETLRAHLAAWYKQYISKPMVTDWQFTTSDARTKLKRLYPVVGKPFNHQN